MKTGATKKRRKNNRFKPTDRRKSGTGPQMSLEEAGRLMGIGISYAGFLERSALSKLRAGLLKFDDVRKLLRITDEEAIER